MSANFLIFCLEQPNKFPNWVNVSSSLDCLTIDNNINCFKDTSGIWLSKSVCSLFPAINNVLKIAFLWFSVELENFLVKSSKFIQSPLLATCYAFDYSNKLPICQYEQEHGDILSGGMDFYITANEPSNFFFLFLYGEPGAPHSLRFRCSV